MDSALKSGCLAIAALALVGCETMDSPRAGGPKDMTFFVTSAGPGKEAPTSAASMEQTGIANRSRRRRARAAVRSVLI